MLSNVPYFKQDTTFTCGPAALQMAFGHVGAVYSEEELRVKLMTSQEHGTRHQALIDVVRREGFHCYVNADSTLLEVAYYAEVHHLPSIVHYLDMESDSAHYAVVIGVTPDVVILHDPWAGKGYRMSRRTFVRRWEDPQYDARHWMMVVAREELPMGRFYHPLGE